MDIPSFEFDLEKNKRNLEKHGISLEEAQELWFVPNAITLAKHSREERFMILGRLGNQVYVAVFTWRRTTVRLITCHRADKKLRRIYEESVHEKKEN